MEVEPAPEGDFSVEDDLPEGDFSGADKVPEGDFSGEDDVPEGVEVVPEGVSAGEVVGESPGEAPPAGASVLGWQADSAVIKPSIKVTIIFDLTVKSSQSFNFRLLSYPDRHWCISVHLCKQDFLAYFLLQKSNVAIPLGKLPQDSDLVEVCY